MSLGGFIRKYTRPKRLFRLALFIFGAWGLYTNYQAHWPEIQAQFKNKPSENILGETVDVVGKTVGDQINRVLGRQTSNDSVSSNSSSSAEGNSNQVETIIDTVKQDLKTFPQREVKKVQKQICQEWLAEEYEEVVEPTPTPTPTP